MKRKFNVEVTRSVEIEVDDEIIDQEFMDDFKEHFFDLETIEEHVEHIAEVYVRGTFQYSPLPRGMVGMKPFIEGYGLLYETNGITLTDKDQIEYTNVEEITNDN